MRRKITLLVIFVFLAVGLCVWHFCHEERIHHNYDEEWIIGKTSLQVQGRYGAFDCTGGMLDTDGLIKCGRCGYVIKERENVDSKPETLLIISFNTNGIAYDVCIGPGGWGG